MVKVYITGSNMAVDNLQRIFTVLCLLLLAGSTSQNPLPSSGPTTPSPLQVPMGQGNLSSPVPLKKEPEYDMTTEELIRYWNYTSETYEAETPDGYVLTLHRIPHGKTGKNFNLSFFIFILNK